jgi:nitrous oxidase accessory protein NosD
MRVKTTAAALMSVALLLGLTASASAHAINVRPGDSIQAAIDQAKPGDKIHLKKGTYHESVEVKKNDLTVEGQGADKTRIVPPPGSPPAFCGFCVTDSDDQGNVISTVENFHASDLTVDGFGGFGILYFGTSGGRVDDTVASNNGEYGIVAFNSSDTRFEWNSTPNNGEAGLYVGDSPDADAVVRGNTSWGNNFGVLVRDASFGEVSRNTLYQNCTGVLFVDTPEPVAGGNWTAKDNHTVSNNRACPPEEDEGIPPFSGAGIMVIGNHDVNIVDNASLLNSPSGPSVASGGIVLRSGAPIGTGPENDNRVVSNVALHNEPFDIDWDGAGQGNVFADNVCQTSTPAGLCHEPQGKGHGHGKGHGKGHDNGHGRGHGHGHHKHHHH